MDQIYATARELTRAMDEIVWAVNPQHDTLDSLVAYLGRFAQNFLSAAGIRCRLDLPLCLAVLAVDLRDPAQYVPGLQGGPEQRGEARPRLRGADRLELKPGGFMLLVADNGRGFAWDPQRGQTVLVPMERARRPATG